MTQSSFNLKEISRNTVLIPIIDSRSYPTKSKISIDSFEVLSQIGKGGFSKVYLARKCDTKMLYALKVIQKEKAAGWGGQLVMREFELVKEAKFGLIAQL